MSNNKSIWNKGVGLLLSDNLQERNFGRLFHLLSNLALNRFVWEGLPKGLEGRHIEKALFDFGQCAFYDDDEVGVICLPATDSANKNVYGDPTHLVLTGINYKKDVKISDVVRIMNNDMCTPTVYHVEYYVNKLFNVDKAIAKNLKQQKRPYIIGATKSSELTLRNIMKKVNEDEEEIYIDEKMNNGGDIGANVLKTNAPYIIDKLQQHKNDLVAEFLTIMGLNNSNANNGKKERLLVDEVNVNNGEILMYLDVDFKNRKRVCDEINKRFGLNVNVKKNIELLSHTFLEDGEDLEEGEEVGKVHNRGLFPFKEQKF